MKIIHNCPKNPNHIPQEYEIIPEGVEGKAIHCGWCNRYFKLSFAHHNSEGYQNPFDARGYFSSKMEAGNIINSKFYPIPEDSQYWEKN